MYYLPVSEYVYNINMRFKLLNNLYFFVIYRQKRSERKNKVLS